MCYLFEGMGKGEADGFVRTVKRTSVPKRTLHSPLTLLPQPAFKLGIDKDFELAFLLLIRNGKFVCPNVLVEILDTRRREKMSGKCKVKRTARQLRKIEKEMEVERRRR